MFGWKEHFHISHVIFVFGQKGREKKIFFSSPRGRNKRRDIHFIHCYDWWLWLPLSWRKFTSLLFSLYFSFFVHVILIEFFFRFSFFFCFSDFSEQRTKPKKSAITSSIKLICQYYHFVCPSYRIKRNNEMKKLRRKRKIVENRISTISCFIIFLFFFV